MTFGVLVHAVLLAQDYERLGSPFRSPQDQQQHFPFMLLAHALTAFAFVWVYLRGKEDKPALAQGARYGLAITVLMVLAEFLIYHAIGWLGEALSPRKLAGLALILARIMSLRLEEGPRIAAPAGTGHAHAAPAASVPAPGDAALRGATLQEARDTRSPTGRRRPCQNTNHTPCR